MPLSIYPRGQITVHRAPQKPPKSPKVTPATKTAPEMPQIVALDTFFFGARLQGFRDMSGRRYLGSRPPPNSTWIDCRFAACLCRFSNYVVDSRSIHVDASRFPARSVDTTSIRCTFMQEHGYVDTLHNILGLSRCAISCIEMQRGELVSKCARQLFQQTIQIQFGRLSPHLSVQIQRCCFYLFKCIAASIHPNTSLRRSTVTFE